MSLGARCVSLAGKREEMSNRSEGDRPNGQDKQPLRKHSLPAQRSTLSRIGRSIYARLTSSARRQPARLADKRRPFGAHGDDEIARIVFSDAGFSNQATNCVRKPGNIKFAVHLPFLHLMPMYLLRVSGTCRPADFVNQHARAHCPDREIGRLHLWSEALPRAWHRLHVATGFAWKAT